MVSSWDNNYQQYSSNEDDSGLDTETTTFFQHVHQAQAGGTQVQQQGMQTQVQQPVMPATQVSTAMPQSPAERPVKYAPVLLAVLILAIIAVDVDFLVTGGYMGIVAYYIAIGITAYTFSQHKNQALFITANVFAAAAIVVLISPFAGFLVFVLWAGSAFSITAVVRLIKDIMLQRKLSGAAPAKHLPQQEAARPTAPQVKAADKPSVWNSVVVPNAPISGSDVPTTVAGHAQPSVGYADEPSTQVAILDIGLQRVSTGEMYPVPPEGATIGKSSKCGICVGNNPRISREHAMITVDRSGINLRDNNSTNFTFVGSRRLQGNEVVHVGIGETFSLADDKFIVIRTNQSYGI